MFSGAWRVSGASTTGGAFSGDDPVEGPEATEEEGVGVCSWESGGVSLHSEEDGWLGDSAPPELESEEGGDEGSVDGDRAKDLWVPNAVRTRCRMASVSFKLLGMGPSSSHKRPLASK